MTTPDGEERHEHLRPALRERPVDRVSGTESEPLDEQHKGGERDAEADERNVNGERQRLHLSRLEEVVLVDGRKGSSRRSQGPRSHGAGDVAAVMAKTLQGFVLVLVSRACPQWTISTSQCARRCTLSLTL